VNRVVRATELLGTPVVSLGGDDLAEVRDVVYDSERGSLLGFTLNKHSRFGGKLAELLPTSLVHSIGRDAIMVESSDQLVAPEAAPDAVSEASPNRDVIGATVLTDEGTKLGEVTDVIVTLGPGAQAVGYELGGGADGAPDDGRPRFIPLPEQLAVSGEALIVPSEVDRFVRDDLAGFGAAVGEFRSQLHESGATEGVRDQSA
jgi:uncharacterized protein YrrD